MKPLRILSGEGAILTAEVLHCGVVQDGDEWDTPTAWPDKNRRAMAREILLRYRRTGGLPTSEEREILATCCG